MDSRELKTKIESKTGRVFKGITNVSYFNSKELFIEFLLIICLLISYYSHFILQSDIIFTHFFYIPIILASLWWAREGILVSVFLAIMLLALHIISPVDIPVQGDVLRASMFVVVGTVVGTLNEKKQFLEDKLQIETALRKSEIKNQALINAIPALIFQIGRDGTILYFIHGKDVHLHIPPDKLLNKKLYDILPEEPAQLWMHHIERTLQINRPQSFEYQLQVEGMVHYFEGTVYPYMESQVIVISQDISEQRQAEKARTISEEKYRVLFETAKEAIFVSDETGRFIDVNQAACESLGYSKEELLTMSIKEIDTDPRGYEAFRKVKKEKLDKIVFEVDQRRKNGTVFPVEIVGCFFTSGSHKLSLAIARDMTQRKWAEEELKKAHQELKYAQVRILQVGKLTAMGEMAAGIVHELTQPLLGISGFTAAMLEDMKHNLEKKIFSTAEIHADTRQAVADLEVIRQQTDHMTAIINTVRAFAQESKTEKTLLNINQTIEKALMLFSQQLRVHNIAVEMNLAPDLPPVLGNCNRLQQVIINLITNALDAIDTNGGKGRLIITTVMENSSIYIHVEDTGAGADKETLSKMFDPFFTTRTKGIGLGLSIVSRIIHDHDGTIHVQSGPGRGCKFTIRLPSSGGIKNA